MKDYVLTLLFLFLGLVACVDDTDTSMEVKDGIPCTISLPAIVTNAEVIQTRAGVEDNITDLYIILFDTQGNRVDGKYFTDINASAGTLSVETTSGRRKIYAVANLTNNDIQITKEDLDIVSSEKELLTGLMKLKQNEVSHISGAFLMSGFFGTESDTEAPVCIVSEKGTILMDSQEVGNCRIYLKKLQSKVSFQLDFSGNCTSFTLDSFRLMNLPEQTTLYSNQMLSEPTYFNKEGQSNMMTEDGKGFEFYMLENRKDATGVTVYDQREERMDLNDEASWRYAPDKSTYVVLCGRYKGLAKRNPQSNELYTVDAYVRYFIHLGDIRKNNFNDFNCLRNKAYQYNITVTGIDKIVVEVEVPDERYDRGDGDVYFQNVGKLIQVDAHYSAVVLEFRRANLQTNFSDADFQIVVKSNQTNYLWENKDTEWVTFLNNGTKNAEARFPGTNSGYLLSADEFIESLKDFKNNGSGSVRYYTAFIKEYYDTDSNWKQYVNQQPRMMNIICKTKNNNGSSIIESAYTIEQKSIQTIYNINNVSSAWGLEWENETTDYITIGGESHAIGLNYGKSYGLASDNSDGYANMWKEIGSSHRWYNSYYIYHPYYGSYHSDLQTAYAACMQRNRDENGDGMIDKAEMKWYLPAIYQYTDMFIGSSILPTSAQLYTAEDYEFNYGGYWLFKHFVSNSNKQILWAEEGGSYGAYGGDDNLITNNKTATQKHLRCIRNLGSNSPQNIAVYSNNVMDLSNLNPLALRPKVNSQELKQHSQRQMESRPYRKFKVAKNTYSGQKFTEQNKLADQTAKSICSDYYEEPNKSDKGSWRLPNVRELLLMRSHGNINQTLMSRTYFSFYLTDYLNQGTCNSNGSLPNGYSIKSAFGKTSRKGFALNGNVVYLLNPDDKSGFSVRCVKDVD